MAAVVFSLASVACGNKMSPVFIVRHCSYRRSVSACKDRTRVQTAEQCNITYTAVLPKERWCYPLINDTTYCYLSWVRSPHLYQ